MESSLEVSVVEPTSVSVVAPSITSDTVFSTMTNGDGFESFKSQCLAFIESQATIVADTNTKKGCDAIIAAAAKIKKLKPVISKIVLEEVRNIEGKPKEIRENLKIIERLLNEGYEAVRKPATEVERLRTDKIDGIKSLAVFDGFKPTSDDINERINSLNNFIISKEFFREWFSDATAACKESELKLNAALESILTEEKKQADYKVMEIKLAIMDYASYRNGITGFDMYDLVRILNKLEGKEPTIEYFGESYDAALAEWTVSVNVIKDTITDAENYGKIEAIKSQLSDIKSLPRVAIGKTAERVAEMITGLNELKLSPESHGTFYQQLVDAKKLSLKELYELKEKNALFAEKTRVKIDAIRNRPMQLVGSSSVVLFDAIQRAKSHYNVIDDIYGILAPEARSALSGAIEQLSLMMVNAKNKEDAANNDIAISELLAVIETDFLDGKLTIKEALLEAFKKGQLTR